MSDDLPSGCDVNVNEVDDGSSYVENEVLGALLNVVAIARNR
jgi:hypothetical protein